MRTEFCDKCKGNGIIICRCAGDSCGCGMDHYDCPYCDTVPEPLNEDDEDTGPDDSQRNWDVYQTWGLA